MRCAGPQTTINDGGFTIQQIVFCTAQHVCSQQGDDETVKTTKRKHQKRNGRGCEDQHANVGRASQDQKQNCSDQTGNPSQYK